MGMSPSSQHSDAELLIDQLYSQGSIDEKVFSLFLQPDNEQSKITVGGYDLDSFSQDGKIFWHKLSNANYWTLDLTAVYYGER